jgi:hypothetical protein
MAHDKTMHDDQMTRLMEHAMLSVNASEELVAGGLSRGRRATRRRRTAQAAGIGATAVLATAAAVAAPSFLGGQNDQRSSVGSPTVGPVSTAAEPTRTPTPQSTPDALPPHLQRAQELLLDALPDQLSHPGTIVRVDYDPDGRGPGEILATVSTDASDIVSTQDSRCDRVTASPAPDDCVDTGAGWVFTGPSVPDMSGNDPGLAGVLATYILRDGRIVNLTAYNAVKVVQGGEPTRIDPVLDDDELVELVTNTEWFD